MQKVCLKCGYERTAKDFAPEFECPKCGVIYEKAETQGKTTEQYAEDAARAIQEARGFQVSQPMGRTRKGYSGYVFVILTGIIVGACFWGYQSGLLSRLGIMGIDAGTIEDSVYKNKYFGFRLTLPEGWNPIDQKTQEEMEKVAGKMIAANQKGFDAFINASSEEAVSMFTVFKHPLGTPVPFNPSVMCMAQNVKHFPGIKKGSDYLYHLKTLMETLDLGPIHIEYSDSTDTEAVGGVDFDVLDLRVHVGNASITQKYYARVMKGYVLSYILTYQTWDDMEELDNCLDTVSFI
jgi:predicted RNA-binding Zn-ribbon protein involved in translation (DUF1610 family)